MIEGISADVFAPSRSCDDFPGYREVSGLGGSGDSSGSGLGLVQGTSASAFAPLGTGTRAESAQMMANLLQRT